MHSKNSEQANDSRFAESASFPADRLLTFREVGALIGSRCKTAHTARNMAAKGLIKAVRLNARVVRYPESSVRALIAGAA
jgi:predicted DNA-binding transcriptional regulator AlpA